MYLQSPLGRHVYPTVLPPNAVKGGKLTVPSWWNIIDPVDIIGAWDFTWSGHKSRDDAFKSFVGDKMFTISAGNPSWSAHDGVNFGGSGVISFPLPADTPIHELSTVLMFANNQNGPESTLDALFSHYIDSSHYVIQNKFSENMVRWSCGDGDSGTIEIAGQMITEGVYGVSGPELYIDGVLLGAVPDPGTVEVSNLQFHLGGLWLGDSYNQRTKFNALRLLIVNRMLTGTEQWEIAYEMKHGSSPPWYLAPGVTENDVVAIYDFANSGSRDAALDGLVGPALEVENGNPDWTENDGFKFNGSDSLKMISPVTIIPGEATIAVRVYDISTPINWEAFAGFENRPTNAVLLQHHPTNGVSVYNGEGYDGTSNNYAINPPQAQDGEWLFNAGGKLYRNGALAPNILTPTVLPASDELIEIGAINDGQFLRAGISHVLIYNKVLTEAQINYILTHASHGFVTYEKEQVTYEGEKVTYLE